MGAGNVCSLKWNERFVDNMLVIAHSSMRYHGTKCINANTKGHKGCDIGMVIRWTDFNDFHTAQTFLGN